ncbi:SWIB/MDM2 domain-containing protein [Sphingomonas dokdonensis]
MLIGDGGRSPNGGRVEAFAWGVWDIPGAASTMASPLERAAGRGVPASLRNGQTMSDWAGAGGRAQQIRVRAAELRLAMWLKQADSGGSEESVMARTAEKRGKDETKAAEKKVKATGKPAGGARGGITAPVTPSPELAEIVGKDDLPRSEVVSKVWDYIKKNDLQDAKDRRQINADDKLEKIFGKKSVSMFEMNKHLSKHLSAKKD